MGEEFFIKDLVEDHQLVFHDCVYLIGQRRQIAIRKSRLCSKYRIIISCVVITGNIDLREVEISLFQINNSKPYYSLSFTHVMKIFKRNPHP